MNGVEVTEGMVDELYCYRGTTGQYARVVHLSLNVLCGIRGREATDRRSRGGGRPGYDDNDGNGNNNL